MTYDLATMKAPRAAGTLLRALVAALENPVTGPMLADKLLADVGVTRLRTLETHEPMAMRQPVFDEAQERAAPGERIELAALDAELAAQHAQGLAAEHARELAADHAARHSTQLAADEAAPRRRFRPETAADFTAAYRDGKLSPVDVAERAIAIVRESDALRPKMRLLIAQREGDVRAQAEASQARYRRGAPLGPLDGVPVAVKDELDQAGYGTTVGTRFLGKSPAARDAEVVRRLRAHGALLLGKANMHEIGLGVTGLNPHHGAARNPYAPGHATGGSSSGSAAAVGAGLCPIALGADGGGSIRIPAGLCGQVGLKPTLGRVSEHGAAEVCWSVAHIGPIAATVRDLALAYAAIAGPDEKDKTSLGQPRVRTDGITRADLRGVRLGVFPAWFDDADAEVVAACKVALAWLTDAGATVVELEIPELEAMRISHLVSIVTEMAASQLLHDRAHRADYGHDVRLNLALARRITGYDYVQAQRLRVRVAQHFARALADVDALVTPTAGRTAPPLPEDALETGESNLEVVGQIIRFAAAANLTGLPALSVPCGYDAAGLPIGLQLMGRAWHEHELMRLAAVVESRAERIAPRVHYRYLA